MTNIPPHHGLHSVSRRLRTSAGLQVEEGHAVAKSSQADPFAHMLATPIRQCFITKEHLPSAFMLRFYPAMHDNGQIWIVSDIGRDTRGRTTKGYWIKAGSKYLHMLQKGKYKYIHPKAFIRPDMADHIARRLQDQLNKNSDGIKRWLCSVSRHGDVWISDPPSYPLSAVLCLQDDTTTQPTCARTIDKQLARDNTASMPVPVYHLSSVMDTPTLNRLFAHLSSSDKTIGVLAHPKTRQWCFWLEQLALINSDGGATESDRELDGYRMERSHFGPFRSPQMVLDYFALSPFWDPECNNAVLRMQTQYNDLRSTEEALQKMTGVEFSVTHQEDPIYVIQKRYRNGPDPKDVEVLAIYYMITPNIYQAPNLYSIVANRLLTSLYHTNAAFRQTQALKEFHPASGYAWKAQRPKPTLSDTGNDSDKDESSEMVSRLSQKESLDFRIAMDRAIDATVQRMTAKRRRSSATPRGDIKGARTPVAASQGGSSGNATPLSKPTIASNKRRKAEDTIIGQDEPATKRKKGK